MTRLARVLPWCAIAAGCYASHGRGEPGPLDGGEADAGSSECAVEEANLAVELALREGPEGNGCDASGTVGDVVAIGGAGGTIEMTLDTCPGCETPNACVLSLANLPPAIAALARDRLSTMRLFDVYVEATAVSANVRDTSLCDGPEPPQCPLLLRAGMGDLAGVEEDSAFGAIDLSFDAPVCAVGPGACDPVVRQLAISTRDPILALFMRQGEILDLGIRGGAPFVVADAASTEDPCIDERPLAEWLIWRSLND
ncbi:MAG: hypothetical protein AB7S26_17700 [Sandaracinaceae bacterium]